MISTTFDSIKNSLGNLEPEFIKSKRKEMLQHLSIFNIASRGRGTPSNDGAPTYEFGPYTMLKASSGLIT